MDKKEIDNQIKNEKDEVIKLYKTVIQQIEQNIMELKEKLSER